MREGYSRGELIADLRAYLRSLGYAQTAELARARRPSRRRSTDAPAAGAWIGGGGRERGACRSSPRLEEPDERGGRGEDDHAEQRSTQQDRVG